ncbi:ribbon-helix-helix protein, CopG family [Mariprofundus sp. NF]|uniref:CopG family ribbon-helix-helix protein n=1 Tax=Mariprofundus sp. NF TaxID=2608716 RepID=UPI0015A10A3F|nr:ribbon-helix-helix domain-containing protein [Mariprofundus sp. NF]NWF39482.1 ribbon-helix-helix protein, CopG family [Mariprofundus sp. NF]
MGQTCTTSIRLDESLAHRLDDAAARLHRRKNGIIVRAIEEYLEKHSDTLLQEEARKQSLLVSSQDGVNEDELWESAHDDSGWQS